MVYTCKPFKKSSFFQCPCSSLGLIFLHLYMFGFNVFIWQRFHISYRVILDFPPRKKFGFYDIMLLSTAFTTILLGGMVIQLFFSNTPKTSGLPLTIMLVRSVWIQQIDKSSIFLDQTGQLLVLLFISRCCVAYSWYFHSIYAANRPDSHFFIRYGISYGLPYIRLSLFFSLSYNI